MSVWEREVSMDPPLRPMVSVITICLNPGKKLRGTLQSVLDQVGVRAESIVIDGGSTDPETCRVLAEFSPKLSYLQSQRDAGISDALNQGLNRCSGDWIVPLNAGDRFMSPASLASFFPEPTGWDALPIRAAIAKWGNHFIPGQSVGNTTSLPERAMISHQAKLVHRRVYDAAGGYDPRFKLRMDYDFWLRALSRFPMKFIPAVLVDYEEGGISGQDPWRFFTEELLAQRLRLDKPLPAIAATCKTYARGRLKSRLRRWRLQLTRNH